MPKFDRWYKYLDPRNLRPKVLLDGSHRARPCEWKATEIVYVVRGPRSYQLEQDWWCQTDIIGCAAQDRVGWNVIGEITRGGLIRVSAGFVWDGPSGPTVDTLDSMAGSCAHDLLYRMARAGHFPPDKRKEADLLAYKIWLQDGMYTWRARLWLKALRAFAWPSYSQQVEEIVHAK